MIDLASLVCDADGNRQCDRTSSHAVTTIVARELTDEDSWPPRYYKYSLLNLLDRLREMSEVELPIHCECGWSEMRMWSSREFIEVAEKVLQIAQGLCLACVVDENLGQCEHGETTLT